MCSSCALVCGRSFFGIAPRLLAEGTVSWSTLLTSCSRETVVVLDHSVSRLRFSEEGRKKGRLVLKILVVDGDRLRSRIYG